MKPSNPIARAASIPIFVAVNLLGTAAHQPTFKAAAELVVIPITVTGGGFDPRARDLTPADFRVYENGVAQTVTLVDRDRRPLSLCVVLDSSESMCGHKQRVAAAAVISALNTLGDSDEVALVVFSDVPHAVLPWTPARDVPVIDWLKWRATGLTAITDALRVALELVTPLTIQSPSSSSFPTAKKLKAGYRSRSSSRRVERVRRSSTRSGPRCLRPSGRQSIALRRRRHLPSWTCCRASSETRAVGYSLRALKAVRGALSSRRFANSDRNTFSVMRPQHHQTASTGA
jgi:hypothetical protein